MSQRETRYIRKTLVDDGAFMISTVGIGVLCPTPETMIFDERAGGVGRYVERHDYEASVVDLDALHHDIVRRFMSGQITLLDQV